MRTHTRTPTPRRGTTPHTLTNTRLRSARPLTPPNRGGCAAVARPLQLLVVGSTVAFCARVAGRGGLRPDMGGSVTLRTWMMIGCVCLCLSVFVCVCVFPLVLSPPSSLFRALSSSLPPSPEPSPAPLSLPSCLFALFVCATRKHGLQSICHCPRVCTHSPINAGVYTCSVDTHTHAHTHTISTLPPLPFSRSLTHSLSSTHIGVGTSRVCIEAAFAA